MKKFYKILFLFLFILYQNTCAQDNSVKAGLGYGFYSMAGLKSLQSEISNELSGINLKAVQSFPPYFNYEFQYTHKVSQKINIGLFFEFLSTGGRNIISDYSGEISVDQIVNGYNLGFLFERAILENKISNFYFTFQISLIYSTLQVKESLKLYGNTASQLSEFSAVGLGIQPGFSYEIISSPIILRTSLGFHAGISKDLTAKDNSMLSLGQKAEWTGFRFEIFTGFYF